MPGPQGIMLESLHDAMAEMYSATLYENVRRGMSENAIEPIVSVEMFDIIQSKLARNARAPARRTAKEEYLLTTKLFLR